jgi:hypothetical protein
MISETPRRSAETPMNMISAHAEIEQRISIASYSGGCIRWIADPETHSESAP